MGLQVRDDNPKSNSPWKKVSSLGVYKLLLQVEDPSEKSLGCRVPHGVQNRTSSVSFRYTITGTVRDDEVHVS